MPFLIAVYRGVLSGGDSRVAQWPNRWPAAECTVCPTDEIQQPQRRKTYEDEKRSVPLVWRRFDGRVAASTQLRLSLLEGADQLQQFLSENLVPFIRVAGRQQQFTSGNIEQPAVRLVQYS